MVWRGGVSDREPAGIAAVDHAGESIHSLFRLGDRPLPSRHDWLCELYCRRRFGARLEQPPRRTLQRAGDGRGLLAVGHWPKLDGDRSYRGWIGGRSVVGQPRTMDRLGSGYVSILADPNYIWHTNSCLLSAVLDWLRDRAQECSAARAR